MPTSIQGELVRHHNQPFYRQKAQPKFFWLGCGTPTLILLAVAFFALRGIATDAGLDVIRGFVLFAIIFMIVQLLLGGGLFAKTGSSLGRGLLVGAGVILLILILGLVGLFSTISQFLQ